MDVRSIYRDANAAIDVMTALIFGIDGVQVKKIIRKGVYWLVNTFFVIIK